MALSSEWSNGNQISFRFTFCHVRFPQLTQYGSVNKLWMSTTLHRAQQMGYISLYIPRGLPAAYAMVASIIWHDSGCELHTQTDTDILCTLQWQTVKKPFPSIPARHNHLHIDFAVSSVMLIQNKFDVFLVLNCSCCTSSPWQPICDYNT